MNRNHMAAAVLFLLALSHFSAALAQMMWDGSCGNNLWHSQCGPGVQFNWFPEQLPTLGDAVVISQSNPIVRIAGGTGDPATVSCQSGLMITNGGQLRIAAGPANIQNLAVTNSSLNLLNGSVLQMTGNSDLSGATLFGNGQLINNGTLTGLSLSLSNTSSFINANGANATISRFIAPFPTSVTNQGGATLTFTPGTGTPGITSTGFLTNSGTFITQHTGNSFFNIETQMLQSAGEMIVQGVSSSLGTVMYGGGTFTGGNITVNDNATLRFTSNGSIVVVYSFAGLPSITGHGNVHFETPTFPNGSDLRINSPLNVNLTGSNGMMMGGATAISLNSTLANHGKARWSGTRIRRGTCPDCTGAFENYSNDFIINPGLSNAVSLATAFINFGTVMHEVGSLVLENDGVFTNHADYHLIRDDIRLVVSNATGKFVNSGSIIKPNIAAAAPSTISAPFVVDDGSTVQVEKSTLAFSSGALEWRGGTFLMEPNVVVRLVNGTHVAPANSSRAESFGRFVIESGAALRVEQGALVRFDLDGPAPDGLHLPAGGSIGGWGEIINMDDFFWSGGTLGVLDSGVITGLFINEQMTTLTGGAIIGQMQGTVCSTGYRNAADATTVQPSGTLNVVNGRIDNHGLWHFLMNPDATPRITGDRCGFTNWNVVVAEMTSGDGTATIDLPFSNILGNLVWVKNGATLVIDQPQDIEDGELRGGSWKADRGGVIRFPEPVFRLTGTTQIEGAHESFPDIFPDDIIIPMRNDAILVVNGHWSPGSRFTNDGTMKVNSGTFSTVDDFDNFGTITVLPSGKIHSSNDVNNDNAVLRLEGGMVETETTIDNGGSVLAFCDHKQPIVFKGGPIQGGFICPMFNNFVHGVIRPGGADAPGPFKIVGHLNLAPAAGGGTLEIELAGAVPIDEHDQVVVEGNVTIGGTLNMHAMTQLSKGQQFTILTSTGSITGQFDRITGAGQYSVTYGSNTVSLTVLVPPQPGDITGDGVVNVADLLLVIQSWGTCPALPQNCPADIAPAPNGDGVVNVADLLMVISNWG